MKAIVGVGVIAASLVAGGVWMLGCSSSGTGSSSGDGGAAGDSSTSGHDSGMGNDSGLSAGDQACASAGSSKDCIRCCQMNHASGSQAFIQAAVQCECTSPGACRTECAASYCNPDAGTIDQPCDTCIGNSLDPDGGACNAPLQNACNASADCPAYLTCADSCPTQ